jgi:lysyl-tRNA synthetase class II
VKRFVLLGIFYAWLILFNYNCYAQATGSLDLLNNAKEYDGKMILYKGEVIGDIMMRGDHAWLHVNDGTVAIGIWASNNLIQNIYYAGDYHKRGDIIEVSGTFHRSCLEHGGDLDIHAQAIKMIIPGATVTPLINKKKVYLGISSLIVVLLFYGLRKFLQHRKQ